MASPKVAVLLALKQFMNDLPSLPGSEDKEFWGDAEVNTNIVPQRINLEGPHYFVRKSGHEAQCTHCEWGFVLDPGDKIQDGHLYDRLGKLVI